MAIIAVVVACVTGVIAISAARSVSPKPAVTVQKQAAAVQRTVKMAPAPRATTSAKSDGLGTVLYVGGKPIGSLNTSVTVE